MKKIFLTLLVAFIGFNAFSQDSEDDSKFKGWAIIWTKVYGISEGISTTDSEYNYAINGIPTSITNSLDIKSGYKIEGYQNLEEYSNVGYNYTVDSYSFKFDNLIRTKDNTIACVLIKMYSGETNKTYYRCIPIGNVSLTEKFSSDFQDWSIGMQKAFAQALMQHTVGSLIVNNGIMNKIMNSPNSNNILKSFGLTEEEVGYVNSMKN